MEGFLEQLYQLTNSTKRVPREDFVSLALARQLERDRPLARFLVDRVCRQEERTGTWKPPIAWKGRTEAQTQVTVWLSHENRAVRADVVLSLLEGPAAPVMILEAKVGDDEPSEGQLQGYRDAFPGALVVSLVEHRRASRCPTSAPVLTWDDVLEGLASGSKAQRASRRDLRHLLLLAQVGDARLAIEPEAWAAAHQFVRKFPGLNERLEACLVALGPNDAVRRDLRHALAKPGLQCEPSEGWGPGVWLNKSLPGSAIQGLCLSLDAGDAARRVVWKLEVYANKALAKALLRADTPWRLASGETRWFILDLQTSSGDRSLRKVDFENALAHGRVALRELHGLVADRAWPTRGSVDAPYAPRLRLPEVRRGIRAWFPVSRALHHSVAEILMRLVGRDANGRRRFQWANGGLLTRASVLPANARLRASLEDNFTALRFAVEGAAGLELAERWGELCAAWTLPGPKPALEEDSMRFPLVAENWNHPGLVDAIVAFTRLALRDDE